MNTIYYIPIEPLDERYTEQWYRWFPVEFRKQQLKHEVIDGIPLLENEIKTGTFLDVNSSAFYKFEQLKKISNLFFTHKIKKDDIFFVADIEFHGIEVIKYLSVLNKIPIKLYGFCHAASYTQEDFFQQTESFAKYYEEGWFNTFDKIFVGSYYHKQQILKHRNILYPDNIIVTGNPYNINEVKNSIINPTKKNQIICSNRPDYEKRPNLTLDVFVILKQKYPDWNFIVTTGRKQWGNGWIRDKALYLQEQNIITIYEGITKQKYFELLSESKIMTGNSIEENFGYCILESLIFNTIPILPNNYSHPELVDYDEKLLFNNIDEQIKQIEYFINNENYDVYKYSLKYNNSILKIIQNLTNEK